MPFPRLHLLVLLTLLCAGSHLFAQKPAKPQSQPDKVRVDPRLDLRQDWLFFDLHLPKGTALDMTVLTVTLGEHPPLKLEELGRGRDSTWFKIRAWYPEKRSGNRALLSVLWQGQPVFDSIILPRAAAPAPAPAAPDTAVAALPRILSVAPLAVKQGDTLSVTGIHFGYDIERIRLYLTDLDDTLDTDGKGPLYSIHERMVALGGLRPDYLTPPDPRTGRQVLTFTVPAFTSPETDLVGDNRIFDKRKFCNLHVMLTADIDGKRTMPMRFGILNQNWYRNLSLYTALGMLAVWLLISWGLWLLAQPVLRLLSPDSTYRYSLADRRKRVRSFLKGLILDSNTNSLSLAKLQALLWSCVIMYGYFVFAIGKYYTQDRINISDLKGSLVTLMGISFLSLVAARYQDKIKPQNKLRDQPPSLKDLISDGRGISLGRVQMLAFTLISVVFYMLMLMSTRILEMGLPEVPENLLLLMGISQGHYQLEKLASSALAVLAVSPPNQEVTMDDCKGKVLQLIGVNFTEGIKVEIENHNPTVVKPELVDSNILKITLEEFTQACTPGITLITVTGDMISISDALVVKAAKQSGQNQAGSGAETVTETETKAENEAENEAETKPETQADESQDEET